MLQKAVLFLTLLPVFHEAGVEMGIGVLEITPEEGLPMAGYSARKEPAQGVLDPLFVRALVLRQDERSVGLVIYDLIGTLGRKVNEELTERIRDKTGLDEILFIATHSHSGPSVGRSGTDGTTSLSSYERKLFAKTEQVLLAAWEDLETVKIGAGSGSADISYNRIKRLPDGSVKMIWENPAKESLGPADHEIYVLKADNLKGKTKLILVNYACHPVILGSDNLLYSADYPGAMCRNVQDGHPDKPSCFFINGACGDMNPYFADENGQPAARIREVGKELAREVLRVAAGIETKEENSSVSVTWKRGSFAAEGRWDVEKWGSAATAPGNIERISQKMDDLHLPYSALLITPEIGLVGLPGEFFSSFQRMLREQSPVKHLLVAGYTDGAFGYFPDIEAAVLGGYGGNDPATYVKPGTGEHLVIEALVSLNELLGHLRPIPASSLNGYRD